VRLTLRRRQVMKSYETSLDTRPCRNHQDCVRAP
jgi:hypothetical protein